jgi:hypothetical protein
MTGLYHVGQKCQKFYGPVCIRKHLSIQHFFSKMAFKKQMLFFRNGPRPARRAGSGRDGGGRCTKSGVGGDIGAVRAPPQPQVMPEGRSQAAVDDRQVKGGGDFNGEGDACIQRRRATL